MAQWEHKERYYLRTDHYQTKTGEQSYNVGGEQITFVKWLDYQCEGGWELFKIFRKHDDGLNSCIFRRLV